MTIRMNESDTERYYAQLMETEDGYELNYGTDAEGYDSIPFYCMLPEAMKTITENMGWRLVVCPSEDWCDPVWQLYHDDGCCAVFEETAEQRHARCAYAIGENGRGLTALKFGSKRLRDFFVRRHAELCPDENEIVPATRSQFLEVEFAELRENLGGELSSDITLDMRIAEYWDGEWEQIAIEAEAAGLL